MFKLLRKRGKGGSKVEVKDLVVPESASLAKYSAKAAVRAPLLDPPHPPCLPSVMLFRGLLLHEFTFC